MTAIEPLDFDFDTRNNMDAWGRVMQDKINEQTEVLNAVSEDIEQIFSQVPGIVEELRDLADEMRRNSERGEHRRLTKIADSLESILPPDPEDRDL